jgi:hypothetical protein
MIPQRGPLTVAPVAVVKLKIVRRQGKIPDLNSFLKNRTPCLGCCSKVSAIRPYIAIHAHTGSLQLGCQEKTFLAIGRRWAPIFYNRTDCSQP